MTSSTVLTYFLSIVKTLSHVHLHRRVLLGLGYKYKSQVSLSNSLCTINHVYICTSRNILTFSKLFDILNSFSGGCSCAYRRQRRGLGGEGAARCPQALPSWLWGPEQSHWREKEDWQKNEVSLGCGLSYLLWHDEFVIIWCLDCNFYLMVPPFTIIIERRTLQNGDKDVRDRDSRTAVGDGVLALNQS